MTAGVRHPYSIPAPTLRQYEIASRPPGRAMLRYQRMISSLPEEVAAVLALGACPSNPVLLDVRSGF